MHYKRLLSMILVGTMILYSPMTSFASGQAEIEKVDSESGLLLSETPSEEEVSDDDAYYMDSSEEYPEDEDSVIVNDDDSESEDDAEMIEEDSDDIVEDDDISSAEEDASDVSSESATDGPSEEDADDQKNPSKDENNSLTEMKFCTGYVPEENPIEITHNEARDPSMTLFGMGDELPSKYTTTTLPPLRNQNQYGTCWAHATMALVEINLMKKGLISAPDLSELHLAYFRYNSVVDPLGGTEGDYLVVEKKNLLNIGGSYDAALSTLARWTGAADEKVARYDRDDVLAMSSGLQDAIAYDDVAHVQDYYVETVDLEEFRNSCDITLLNPVKKMVYEQGAVGISFATLNGLLPETNEATFNYKNNCFYNPIICGTNHAVAIVGWDDDFPKENFGATPPGDGAFLARNSWTTEEEAKDSFHGYFWMSYYEGSLSERFYSVDAELANNYDNNYEYDGIVPHNLSYSWEYDGANVFTAHAEYGINGEELKAVSFYSSATNVDYTVEIYTDVVDTPDSGVLVDSATTTGTIGFAGVHTIHLNNSVYLEPGSRFAVVIHTSSRELLFEKRCSYTSSDGSVDEAIASKPGESFRWRSDKWEDTGTDGNFRIKAFTCNRDSSEYVAPTDISFDNVENNYLSLTLGEVFKVVSRVQPASASDRTITWSSSNEAVAKVKNGQIEAIGPGEAVITASMLDGKLTRELEVKVEDGIIGIKVYYYRDIDWSTDEVYDKCTVTCTPSCEVVEKDIVWESSDEDVLTIGADGRINKKMMGIAMITGTYRGKSSYIYYYVGPSDDFIDYEATDDKVITLKWQKAKNCSEYILDREGIEIARIKDDGRDTYTFVDDYYKDGENERANYSLYIKMSDGLGGTDFSIIFSKSYKITYVLNGGTQNPLNPNRYNEGRTITFLDPTPPEGYDFAGWYSDKALTRRIYRIMGEDKGDITVYAKYTPTPPKLTVDKPVIYLSKGGSTKVTATCTPETEDVRYIWTTRNSYIVEPSRDTPKGNIATFTAGNQVGSTYVTLSATGISAKKITIDVFVVEYIRFIPDKITITAEDGNSVKLTVDVDDEYKDKLIAWSSSDESVATVSNGILYPVYDRDETKTVTITARLVGTDYFATCEVTVVKKPVTEAPAGAVSGTDIEASESVATQVKRGALFTMSSATTGASIYYALGGKEPSLKADGTPADQDTLPYNEGLEISADTIVKAIAHKETYQTSAVSSFIFKIKKDDRGDITDDALWKDIFHEDSTNVPDGIWYTFRKRAGGYTPAYTSPEKTNQIMAMEYHSDYTGATITFNDSVNVYHGTRKLEEGRDYTLAYKNNTLAAGPSDVKVPMLTVKGKGNYASTATFSFTIDPISIDGAEVTSETQLAVMAGKSTKLSATKPVVKFAGKALKAGKDYNLTYHENDRAGKAVDPATTILSEAGKTYVIVITGDGNFSGDMSQAITIKTKDPKATISATKLKITDAQGKALKLKFAYSASGVKVKELFDDRGGTVQPAAYVMNGKTPLRYGVDYTVRSASGEDTLSASGKHSIIIEGLDAPDASGVSIYGTKTETLEIVGTAMSKVKVAGLLSAIEYTGKQIGFTINEASRQLESDFGIVTLSYIDASKQTVSLIPSVDGVSGDYTVSYPAMEAPGKYTIVFTGINGFNGTIKKTVTVKAFNVKNNAGGRLKITVDDAVFSKAGARPSVKVQFTVDGMPDTPMTLKEGIDYSLTYKNNTKVADKNAKGAPTVTVKGIGNFTGSNATSTFTISKASIESTYLFASDVKYNARGKAGYFLVVPKLYQDGKALAVGKGKDVEALNKSDVEYTYAGVTKLQDGITKYEGDVVSPDDLLNPGTVIRMSIKTSKLTCSEGSNYKNESPTSDAIEGYYRVVDPAKSISSYKAELRDKSKPFFNNGDTITLKESDLRIYKVVKGVTDELDVMDYQIKSVTNNRFIGTATITLEGRGDYNGTKTVTLKIAARKLSGN